MVQAAVQTLCNDGVTMLLGLGCIALQNIAQFLNRLKGTLQAFCHAGAQRRKSTVAKRAREAAQGWR